MPKQKLTIVPVTLHRENNNASAEVPADLSPKLAFTIKTAAAEISFFDGVEEHVIQTVLRELKQW